MSANRLLTIRATINGVKSVESFKWDSFQFNDSEALHRVLTIRDPGEKFQVSFSSPRNGFPIDTPRLI